MSSTDSGLVLTQSKVPIVIAVPVTVLTLATVCVSLRFWLRTTRRGGLWVDDWLILLALSFSFVGTMLILRQIPRGYAQKLTEPPTEECVLLTTRDIYFAQLIYFLSIGCVKFSVLFFYLRLTRTLRLQVAVWATMAVVGASTVALTLGNILECWPVAYAWDRSIPGGTCIDRWAFWASGAAVNLVTDLVVYALPLPAIWSMRLMARKQKVALATVFGLGFMTVVAGIMRLSAMVRHRDGIEPIDHPTWDYILASVSSIAETNVGIVGACLPSLKPLFGCIFPSPGASPGDASPNDGGEVIHLHTDEIGKSDSHDEDHHHVPHHHRDGKLGSTDPRVRFWHKPTRRDNDRWHASDLEGSTVATSPGTNTGPVGATGEWPASYGHNNRVSNHEVLVEGNYNAEASPPGSSSSSDEEAGGSGRRRARTNSSPADVPSGRSRSVSDANPNEDSSRNGMDGDARRPRNHSDGGAQHNVTIIKTTRFSVSRSASVSGGS